MDDAVGHTVAPQLLWRALDMRPVLQDLLGDGNGAGIVRPQAKQQVRELVPMAPLGNQLLAPRRFHPFEGADDAHPVRRRESRHSLHVLRRAGVPHVCDQHTPMPTGQL